MSRSAMLWEAHWRLRFGILYLLGSASSVVSAVIVERASPNSLATGVLCGLALAYAYGGIRDVRRARELRRDADGLP